MPIIRFMNVCVCFHFNSVQLKKVISLFCCNESSSKVIWKCIYAIELFKFFEPIRIYIAIPFSLFTFLAFLLLMYNTFQLRKCVITQSVWIKVWQIQLCFANESKTTRIWYTQNECDGDVLPKQSSMPKKLASTQN